MIMSISLQKGQKVNLSKEKKGLSRVVGMKSKDPEDFLH